MKICIIKLSAMGDIIHTMVALQYIKKNLPNIQIDWIVEESFRAVLEYNPHIDNILTINLKSIKKNKL
jgi:heptosyltransferase-1